MPIVSMRASETAREWAAQLRNRPQDAERGRNLAILWEGLAMCVLRPKEEPRGLIVHLGGANTGNIEREFLVGLVERGWAVLSMPYVGMPGGNATKFYLAGKDGKPPMKAYRVAESATTRPYLTPLSNPSMSISLPTTIEVLRTPEELGERIAAVVDDRMAEVAYAVEAVLGYLDRTDPALTAKPTVLIGCSAGALVTPAVAARLPGAFQSRGARGRRDQPAGHGLKSSLGGVAPPVEWSEGGDVDEERSATVDSYIRHAQLDADRTAVALRGIPTLMLHAAFDAIVPAAGGMRLWERLGRPERWNLLGGHLGLFVLLPGQSHDVDRWLREHVPPAPSTLAPIAAPSTP